jgi:hypothetical protein
VNWLWLNISLMAVFFLAMMGIPLWLVFKHPDTGPAAARAAARRQTALAPAEASGAHRRELAGASR